MDAKLNWTILREANLTGAYLTDAILNLTKLTGADLTSARLVRVSLKNIDLSGVNLTNADLMDADLSYANLSGGDEIYNLDGAHLYGAKLSGLDLREKNLSSDVSFEEADLSNADLSGVSIYMANFEGANLSNANLEGANLSEANLSRADLSGANLEGTDLSEANLDGTKLAGVIQASISFLKINKNITTDPHRGDIDCSYNFDSENFLKILNRLDHNQLKETLGIGDEVPASEYLQDVVDKLENTKVKSQIMEVLDGVKLLEGRIQSTTPSSGMRPSKRMGPDPHGREGESSGKRPNTSGRGN